MITWRLHCQNKFCKIVGGKSLCYENRLKHVNTVKGPNVELVPICVAQNTETTELWRVQPVPGNYINIFVYVRSYFLQFLILSSKFLDQIPSHRVLLFPVTGANCIDNETVNVNHLLHTVQTVYRGHLNREKQLRPELSQYGWGFSFIKTGVKVMFWVGVRVSGLLLTNATQLLVTSVKGRFAPPLFHTVWPPSAAL